MIRLNDDFECRFAGLPQDGRLLVWEITNKCNLKCFHCCNNSNPFADTGNEVTLDDIKNVVKQFKENRIIQAYFSAVLKAHNIIRNKANLSEEKKQ